MKIMKKILLLLLSMTIIMTAVVACDKNECKNPPVEKEEWELLFKIDDFYGYRKTHTISFNSNGEYVSEKIPDIYVHELSTDKYVYVTYDDLFPTGPYSNITLNPREWTVSVFPGSDPKFTSEIAFVTTVFNSVHDAKLLCVILNVRYNM